MRLARHFRLLYDHAGITDDVLSHKYVGEGTDDSPYLVSFLPDDPWDPQQFSKSKKWSNTFVQAMAALAVSFASTAYSGGIASAMLSFDVSSTVAIMGVSFFVLGFAVGPLVWAPLSELYGRQRVIIVSFLGMAVFGAACVPAKNIETLVVLRFLAGAFGSSPLSNAGGVLADMFTPSERGPAGAVFLSAPFMGPALGPIAGGFLAQEEGLSWNLALIASFSGVVLLVSLFVCPETYAPYLLRQRASALSKQTGQKYESKIRGNSRSMSSNLTRPLVLLFREPIVFLTSIYMAIAFGILYLFFAAFPIVFQLERGWSPGVGALPFLGIATGMMLSVLYVVLDNRRYVAHAAKAAGGIPDPEVRLPPAILGSVIMPVGLFWFAWTNGLEIHWISPVIASAFFGFGFLLVYMSLLGYLIDAYVIHAASALAANSLLRSLFGTAFPLFTSDMYRNMGIHWASSIPAFLTVLCLPFPFLFWRYGDRVRIRCKYAREAAEVRERMRGAVV